jgi:hypothetical protein
MACLIKDSDYESIDHPVYKYRVLRDIVVQTEIRGFDVREKYFDILPNGHITVRAGYCWDGASGPTFDTPASMRGSLIHDIIYQCLREGQLLDGEYNKKKHSTIRLLADREIYSMCREDGMRWVRASCWYMGVRLAGSKHCRPRYF